jgi:hypothetical protein
MQIPAPECLENAPATFVDPGQTHHELIDDEGTEMYQCCIHPWMRVIVRAK